MDSFFLFIDHESCNLTAIFQVTDLESRKLTERKFALQHFVSNLSYDGHFFMFVIKKMLYLHLVKKIEITNVLS